MMIRPTLLLALLGLASSPSLAIEGLVATYQVREPGIAPYTQRLLLTASHLRLDDGEAGSDYTLFDRRKPHVDNVVHTDESILQLDPLNIAEPSPITLELKELKIAMPEDAPRVADKAIEQRRLMANGEQCWYLFSAPGLLPDLVSALGEFRRAMAGEQARVMMQMPADLRSACDLANHIYAPTRHLAYGLPIHTIDEQGREQRLVDFRVGVELDAALFTLPESYHRYSPQSLQGQ